MIASHIHGDARHVLSNTKSVAQTSCERSFDATHKSDGCDPNDAASSALEGLSIPREAKGDTLDQDQLDALHTEATRRSDDNQTEDALEPVPAFVLQQQTLHPVPRRGVTSAAVLFPIQILQPLPRTSCRRMRFSSDRMSARGAAETAQLQRLSCLHSASRSFFTICSAE